MLDYFKGKLKSEDFLHLDSKTGIKDWEEITILYSAHGIPMRLIKKGHLQTGDRGECKKFESTLQKIWL